MSNLARSSHSLVAFGLLLFCAQPAVSETYFLRDGQLSGFDGKQTRGVKLSGAAQLKATKPEAFLHLHDWKKNGLKTQFLLSTKHDERYLEGTDSPSGFDLWLRAESGDERLLTKSGFRAKFSPDAQRIAYTTTDCILHVEDPDGKKILETERAYNPSWKHDGAEIVFEQVPAGRKVHYPETLRLAKLNVASGEITPLTDGAFDDVRPEFHPSGKWILFVSGGRTGLASFWQIDSKGGAPSQVTNLGRRRVDENFVPTPYRQTIWSSDGRWFVYDFKSGETRQVWGLELNPAGKLLRATKLADGLNPQWVEDGKSFVYLKHTDGGDQPATQILP